MTQKRRRRPSDDRGTQRRRRPPDDRGTQQRRRLPDEHEIERRRAQTAGKQAARRKKRRRKRKIVKWILILLVTAALLGGLGYLSTLVFKLEQIKVTKNQYTAGEDVVNWIKQDRYAGYTLYVWWKYNHTEPVALPAAESVKVRMTSPQEVTVEVKEKTFTGRIGLNGEFLYFDEEGIASYRSPDVIEGVMLVEGAEVDADRIQLGKTIPVSDETVFEKISEIAELLKKQELIPDKVGFDHTDLTLWFEGIQIQIGSGDYKLKLEQIAPILTKLKELYPGQSGVLHLENYEQGTDFIRFVPKREEEQPPQTTEESGQTTEETGE